MIDHPDALWFLDVLERSTIPRSGLVLLDHTGSHARATDILRTLEDAGLISCVGPARGCPGPYRGDLVGQLYVVRDRG